ncbi:MAG TPA: acyltransferase family protein [Actinomycetota bacterium]|nr:acyltransferase family protein [Actinomycetota bacterium]
MQRALASRTEADPYIDFLRLLSIGGVVVGHWFIAVVWWDGQRIGVHNSVGPTAGLWLLTWLVQLLPLFFFAGGYANATVYDSQLFRDWVRMRAIPLLVPLVLFMAVLSAAQLVLHFLNVGADGLIRGSTLPFSPLWPMFAYVIVTVSTPMMLTLHRRARPWVLVGLLLGIALVDLLRFWPNVPLLGWLNLILVWTFAHQLGFFYVEGSLDVRRARWMAVGGFLGLVVLTNMNVYPRNMIGTDLQVSSNLNPPTLCIAALSIWLVGLAVVVRQPVVGWLKRKRIWGAVPGANTRLVTIFLWHLGAYVLAILALYPMGLGRASDGSLLWWLQRPLWLVVPGIFLLLLVTWFGRFERPSPPLGRG